MNKILYAILAMVVNAHVLKAQDDFRKIRILTTGFGYTKNVYYGKGDFGGFFWNSIYTRSITKRWSLIVGAAATIHEGKVRVLYEDNNNLWQEGEIRHMTGGLQGNVEMAFNLVSSNSHLLQIGLGPVFRYQITTFPNYGWVNFYPDFYFRDSRYRRSFGVGGSGFITYSYIFKNHWILQVRASLQYVSTNDNQNMFGLSVGKVLSDNN